MKNLIMYKKGEPSFVRWIKKRIRNNLNFIALFTGPTGSSKSYSMMDLALELDPKFNPKEQIAFGLPGLMRIINQFNEKGTELNKRKFKVCGFDEVEVGANRREWQSKTNRFLNYLLATFRHQNIIVLFTTPYEDYLDSAALKLFHAKFECEGWSKKTKKSTLRPKIYQYNAQKRRMYEHSLHVITPSGVQKMTIWKVNCPPPEITIPYEEIKTKFTTNLNRKMTQELEAMEHADNIPKIDIKNELNPESMQPAVWEEVTKNGYISQPLLAKKMGKNVAQLNKNILSMRKKGYDVRKYKVDSQK
jgi:hypothetical protein